MRMGAWVELDDGFFGVWVENFLGMGMAKNVGLRTVGGGSSSGIRM